MGIPLFRLSHGKGVDSDVWERQGGFSFPQLNHLEFPKLKNCHVEKCDDQKHAEMGADSAPSLLSPQMRYEHETTSAVKISKKKFGRDFFIELVEKQEKSYKQCQIGTPNSDEN